MQPVCDDFFKEEKSRPGPSSTHLNPYVRAYLDEVRAYLLKLHDEGAPSRRINEEHAELMFEKSYLPAVGPTPEGEVTIDVFEKTTGILQELEKAHIYIAELNETVKQLQERLTQLESREAAQ